MIHWLIQTTAVHPDLARGLPPPGLLSGEETAVFRALKSEKRRQDWLLGRWTAKHLLQQRIRQGHGQALPTNAISILPAADGAPIVTINSPFTIHNSPFTISISHSHNTAFCAAVERPNWPLGADIERIETRADGFVGAYFSAEEQALARQVPPEMRDVWVTAVWSAKEAALKAIHQGLNIDTRRVSCLIDPAADAPPGWTPLRITWDGWQNGRFAPALDGWWRVHDEFVLTLAAQHSSQMKSNY